MDKKALGMYINAHRKELGYTQEELANMLNVSFKTVSSWEIGRTFPDLDMFERICNIFCVTIQEAYEEAKSYEEEKHNPLGIIVGIVVLLLFASGIVFGIYRSNNNRTPADKNNVLATNPSTTASEATEAATTEEATTEETIEETAKETFAAVEFSKDPCTIVIYDIASSYLGDLDEGFGIEVQNTLNTTLSWVSFGEEANADILFMESGSTDTGDYLTWDEAKEYSSGNQLSKMVITDFYGTSDSTMKIPMHVYYGKTAADMPQDMPIGLRYLVIRKNSPLVKRCLDFLYWLATPDGSMTYFYGPKGESWDVDENGRYYVMAPSPPAPVELAIWNLFSVIPGCEQSFDELSYIAKDEKVYARGTHSVISYNEYEYYYNLYLKKGYAENKAQRAAERDVFELNAMWYASRLSGYVSDEDTQSYINELIADGSIAKKVSELEFSIYRKQLNMQRLKDFYIDYYSSTATITDAEAEYTKTKTMFIDGENYQVVMK